MVLGFPALCGGAVKNPPAWTSLLAKLQGLPSRVLVLGWVLGQSAPSWWGLANADAPALPC